MKKLLGGMLGAMAMDAWEEGKHPRAPDGKFGSGKAESEPAKLTGPVSGRGLKQIHEGAAESVRTGQSKEKFLANLKEQGYHEAHIAAASRKHDELSASSHLLDSLDRSVPLSASTKLRISKAVGAAGGNVEEADKILASIPHGEPMSSEAHRKLSKLFQAAKG